MKNSLQMQHTQNIIKKQSAFKSLEMTDNVPFSEMLRSTDKKLPWRCV